MSFVEKQYLAAEKFRTVPAKYFFPSRRIQSLLEVFGEDAGLSRETVIKFLKLDGQLSDEDVLLAKTEDEKTTRQKLIIKSVQFTFGRATFAEGRFNTSSFAALYTAKSIETSKHEYRHVLDTQNLSSADVVVFSLYFSGQAADYRPIWLNGGKVTMPLEHAKCQTEAILAAESYDALVAPSMRDKDGSCCAIFNEECVLPSTVYETTTI